LPRRSGDWLRRVLSSRRRKRASHAGSCPSCARPPYAPLTPRTIASHTVMHSHTCIHTHTTHMYVYMRTYTRTTASHTNACDRHTHTLSHTQTCIRPDTRTHTHTHVYAHTIRWFSPTVCACVCLRGTGAWSGHQGGVERQRALYTPETIHPRGAPLLMRLRSANQTL
jgi:hypothetical protein